VDWPEGVDTVVLSQLGVQAPTREEAGPAAARVLELLALPDGPSSTDRGWYVDASGAANEVFVCYWTSPRAHASWWASPEVASWWAGLPLDGAVGHWHETLTSPVRRHETMYSAPSASGPAALVQPLTPTDLHDYPFAALDRIPASGGEDLTGRPDGVLTTDLPAGADSRGRRVTVTAAPENLCLIRTAQDWSQAPEEQWVTYRDRVRPGYRAGVEFLGSAPEDTGCLSIRLLQDVEPADGAELPATNTIAWFRGIDDLLRWAHHHPTHHRILGDFWTAVVEPFAADLRLLLWHEVHVAPAGAVSMSYVNCHPGTGVLPRATG
jgi:phenylacetaldoxime dehydratase/aldoxime dehydratase